MANDGETSTKLEAAEAGKVNRKELRAAPVVVVGVARTKADMEVKAASADHTEVVEVMEEEEVLLPAGMDNSQEATQAGTTHKARAVDPASQAKVVGIINRLRAADTGSLRKATIPMDSKAAMIPSLALEDQMRIRHRFFSRYPGYLVVFAPRRGRSSNRSSAGKLASQSAVDGVR